MAKKQIIILFISIFLFIPIVFCILPSSEYSKIFLNPFYRASMTNGVNYTYTLNLSTPDGISKVNSAIVSLQAYITPTVTFDIWVNNLPCNTASYTVSTTYASSGQGLITFDCSNVIKQQGIYTVKIRPTQANTGASTSWIDLSYINNQNDYVSSVGNVNAVDSVKTVDMVNQPKLSMHGTEYATGTNGKLWIQLLNSSGEAINTAICYVDIYTPYNTQYLEKALMSFIEDGVYYYDLSVPFYQGVYPAIANCYYDALSVPRTANYYTIYSGVLDGGTLANTYSLDTTYLTIKTDKNGGKTPINRLNVSFYNYTDTWINCGNISEELMTSLSFYWNGIWNTGTVNHNIILYIYNYSSSKWITMQNVILGGLGGSTQSVDNSITTKNISKSLGLTSSSSLIFRFEDTSLNEGAKQLKTDYLYVSCDRLANQHYTEVKGSSEMHVTSSTGYSFDVKSLCGDSSDGTCALFYDDANIWNSFEGLIVENLTITSFTPLPFSEIYNYETAREVDCSAIIQINKYSSNGTKTDILGDTVLSTGSKNNCKVSLPIETSGKIEIIMQNYMKWDLEKIQDETYFYNKTIYPFCMAYINNTNLTYQIPVTVLNQSSDIFFTFCNNALDNIYWSIDYYSLSLPVTTTGEYESFMYEMQFFEPLIKEDFNIVTALLRSENQVETLELARNNPQRVWNYTNRTVSTEHLWVGGTEYSTMETTGRIVARILDNAGNPVNSAICNLTIFNPIGVTIYKNDIMSIPVGQVNGIYYYDFNQSGLIGVHTYTIDCTKLGQKYFLMGTYHVFGNNLTAISENVWQYNNRTLTQNLSINPTQIAESVWNWNGSISQNILDKIAEAIWQFVGGVREVLT